MTTNVLDRRFSRVTSDSRWSVMVDVRDQKFIWYADDTGFDKIAERQNAVMVCAGDAKLIEAWKAWFSEPLPSNDLPPTDRIELDGSFHELYVAIVEKPSFTVLFYSGDYDHVGGSGNFEDADASFTGSGGGFAKCCYTVNACSLKCVATAAESDPATGGEVKFVDVAQGTSNVGAELKTIQAIRDKLVTEGTLMNMTTKAKEQISGLTKTELTEALAANKVSIAAPTGRAPRAWTMEEKLKVSEVMRRIVESEKVSPVEPA